MSQEVDPATGTYPVVDETQTEPSAADSSAPKTAVAEDPSTGSTSVFDAPATAGPADATGSALVVPPVASAPPKRSLRASDLPGRERRRRVRLQARRVRRIVRHIEPWSVLKISVIFYLCLWVILMIAGVMIWGGAESAGAIKKIENLVQELFAQDSFSIDAEQIFRGVAMSGFVLVIAGTAFNVLLSVLFNLISDLTGGLRVTVIEEESARFRPRRGRRPAPASGSQPKRRPPPNQKRAKRPPPRNKGDAARAGR